MNEARELKKLFEETKEELDKLKPWQKTNKVPLGKGDVKVLQFKPSSNYVLVSVLDEASKSAGGIIIPDVAKEKQYRGKVVVTGPGKYHDHVHFLQVSVKPDDVVVFRLTPYQKELTVNGEEYLLISEDDIFGTLIEG